MYWYDTVGFEKVLVSRDMTHKLPNEFSWVMMNPKRQQNCSGEDCEVLFDDSLSTVWSAPNYCSSQSDLGGNSWPGSWLQNFLYWFVFSVKGLAGALRKSFCWAVHQKAWGLASPRSKESATHWGRSARNIWETAFHWNHTQFLVVFKPSKAVVTQKFFYKSPPELHKKKPWKNPKQTTTKQKNNTNPPKTNQNLTRKIPNPTKNRHQKPVCLDGGYRFGNTASILEISEAKGWRHAAFFCWFVFCFLLALVFFFFALVSFFSPLLFFFSIFVGGFSFFSKKIFWVVLVVFSVSSLIPYFWLQMSLLVSKKVVFGFFLFSVYIFLSSLNLVFFIVSVGHFVLAKVFVCSHNLFFPWGFNPSSQAFFFVFAFDFSKGFLCSQGFDRFFNVFGPAPESERSLVSKTGGTGGM